LHTVICDKCGKETQVPFKPTGDKPVYCRECFKLTENTQSSRSDRNDRSRGQRREFNRRDDGPQMHQAICDKCGKECEVPFRPTEGKPIYCYDCFKKNDEPKAVEFEKTPMPKANEIEEINKKLDKIMKALNIE
jgi:CxxC-x17-CxxC domain-containing protein